MIVRVSVVLRRTVCDDIDSHFDNLSGSHHQSQVNCESSVDVISLWSLFWLVDDLVMLLVVCQISRDVIGCEDCKTWLVRFDPPVMFDSVPFIMEKLFGLQVKGLYFWIPCTEFEKHGNTMKQFCCEILLEGLDCPSLYLTLKIDSC